MNSGDPDNAIEHQFPVPRFGKIMPHIAKIGSAIGVC
jgi:hypothetical protein